MHTETQDEKAAVEQKPLRLHVTPPLLTIGILILLFTLGWAFLMGFLVGRGEDPSKRLSSFDVFGDAEPAASLEQKEPAKEPVKEEAHAQAKGAEEKEQTRIHATAQAVKDGAHTPAPQEVHPFTRPKGSGKDAWGQKAEKEKVGEMEHAGTQEKKPEPKQQDTGPRYAVIYQVATLPSEADAKQLAQKFQARGLAGRVAKHGKVFRVLIDFRGTRSEASEMKSRNQSLAKGRWLIVKSTRISQPAEKNAAKKR